MPRPNVPPSNVIVAIARGLKAVGINEGMIRCPDGTQIHWGESGISNSNQTPFEKWKANRNETS